MFELDDKVVVIKGPMKGNEGVIEVIYDSLDKVGVKFDYLNPCTKSGVYYFKKDELDSLSLYPKDRLTFIEDVNTTDKFIPFWVSSLCRPKLEIKNVLFKEPATIVFWTDNTKTVVKCQDDERYDPEKGLAMAISKKFLGNKRDYYHTFLKWLKKYDKEYTLSNDDVDELLKDIIDEVQKADKKKVKRNDTKFIFTY